MLKLIGKAGKSIVVDAIQTNYKDSRVYSYDDYMVPTMESYHVNSNDCTIDEFCELIYDDIISKFKRDDFNIGIVVIYTNLKDVHKLYDLANKLESKQLVKMVVVTSQ